LQVADIGIVLSIRAHGSRKSLRSFQALSQRLLGAARAASKVSQPLNPLPLTHNHHACAKHPLNGGFQTASAGAALALHWRNQF
jgi:hypothetical protein